MNRGTLVSAVVFVALAAAAIVTLQEKPERGITKISFTTVKPETVTAILIEGPNPAELRKQDGVWMLGAKRADESAVRRVLDAVTGMESSELVTRNSARFGELEVEGEKATRVKLQAGSSTVAEFAVGTASAGGSHVRVGDAVYMVSRARRETFSHTRSGWLDLTLFSDKPDAVQRVEMKLRGEPAYALVRDGEEWKLEDPSLMPQGHRFDRAAARRLVSSLATARARDLLDKDPGNEVSGLTGDADTVIFQVAAGEGETSDRNLQLGSDAENDQVYARASTRDDVVTLPKYLAGSLRKKLAELRDLTLMFLDTAKVKRLELVRAKNRLVFERTDNAWKIAESSEEAAKDFALDDAMVRGRLAGIAGVRALAEAPATPAKAAGLSAPAATISVTFEDGATAKLEFGQETKSDDQDAVFARGNADDRVYLLAKRDRDRLLGGLETFAKREPAGGLGNIDPAALRDLPPEVRESLLRQLAEQQQRQKLMESLQSGQAAGK